MASFATCAGWMKIGVLLGMCAAASSAFQLSTHSHKQRRALRPALFARHTNCLFNCPEWNLTKWVDDRSKNFWQTSEETLDATGGGDAGIRGATLLAASVNRGVTAVDRGVTTVDRGVTAIKMIASALLVISMESPGATRVWPQACALAMFWIQDGLRCLQDLVFKFRRAARSIAPGSPSVHVT